MWLFNKKLQLSEADSIDPSPSYPPEPMSTEEITSYLKSQVRDTIMDTVNQHQLERTIPIQVVTSSEQEALNKISSQVGFFAVLIPCFFWVYVMCQIISFT